MPYLPVDRLQKTLVSCAAIVAVCTLTVGWSLIAGKDLNWDQINYHFYSAYSFVTGRLSQDFMAANLQSYLNPIPYLPFYGMVRQGWHSMAIASVLACVHAFNIILAYFITKETSVRNGSLWGIAGAALAFLSPVFLLEAGTTFSDITTAVLVLLAVLLLLRQKPGASWWSNYAFLAGVAGGAAAGLKITNAVYAPALAATLFFLPLTSRDRIRAIALLAIGGIVGAVATHGYWSYLLWQEFKNPFFPFFNEFFASSDYSLINHKHKRFLPDGLWDVVRFPFDAMLIRERLYVEGTLPDLRFAALYLLALIAAGCASYRLLGKAASRASLRSEAQSLRLFALSAFVLTAFVLWMWTSGNGRYGLIISVLIGPMLAAWASHIFSQGKYALAFLIALIALQAIHLQHGTYRWATGHWTENWYDEIVPDDLRQKPYLYLSIGRQSHSFVAPFLSPGSAFTNPVGQMSIDIEGPGGDRIARLLNIHEGRVRMLKRISAEAARNDPTDHWIANVNAHLARFSMAIDGKECLTIRTDGELKASELKHDVTGRPPYHLITCALKKVPPSENLIGERKRVEAVVEKIIAWCPRMFKPSYTVIERNSDGWHAAFEDSDMGIHIKGSMIHVIKRKSTSIKALGKIEDWEEKEQPRDCAAFHGAVVR